MPDTYRIGQLAARTGRSVHAIRWYETQEWNTALRLIEGKVDFYGEWIATGERPGKRKA